MEHSAQIDVERKMEELTTSLRCLLDEQLAAGRRGDFSGMVQLGELADAVVARIVGQGGNASAILEARREELGRLYDELFLVLRAEQTDVEGRLKKLRRVKRAVGAYRVDR